MLGSALCIGGEVQFTTCSVSLVIAQMKTSKLAITAPGMWVAGDICVHGFEDEFAEQPRLVRTKFPLSEEWRTHTIVTVWRAGD